MLVKVVMKAVWAAREVRESAGVKMRAEGET